MDNLAELERHFGRPLNTFERVAAACPELLAVVLANNSLDDFELVDPCDAPLPSEMTARLHTRGLAYFGCMGLAGSQFRSAFVSSLPESTIRALAHAFGLFAAKKLAPKDEGAEWLRNLHALPDTREN